MTWVEGIGTMDDRPDEAKGLGAKLFWICFVAILLYAIAVKLLIF
jgi:hypothetical protein